MPQEEKKEIPIIINDEDIENFHLIPTFDNLIQLKNDEDIITIINDESGILSLTGKDMLFSRTFAKIDLMNEKERISKYIGELEVNKEEEKELIKQQKILNLIEKLLKKYDR